MIGICSLPLTDVGWVKEIRRNLLFARLSACVRILALPLSFTKICSSDHAARLAEKTLFPLMRLNNSAD